MLWATKQKFDSSSHYKVFLLTQHQLAASWAFPSSRSVSRAHLSLHLFLISAENITGFPFLRSLNILFFVHYYLLFKAVPVLFNSLGILGIWFPWKRLCSITVLNREITTPRVPPFPVGTAFYCQTVHRFRNTTSSYSQVVLKSINIHMHACIYICAGVYTSMCLWYASGRCDNLPDNVQSLCSAAAFYTLCCLSCTFGCSTSTPDYFPKSFCL